MARGETQVWQVVEPFAVFEGRTPDVFGPGRMVGSDDPILRTHRQFFAPVTASAQKNSITTAATSVLVPNNGPEATHG
jgi:hypothetical protein